MAFRHDHQWAEGQQKEVICFALNRKGREWTDNHAFSTLLAKPSVMASYWIRQQRGQSQHSFKASGRRASWTVREPAPEGQSARWGDVRGKHAQACVCTARLQRPSLQRHRWPARSLRAHEDTEQLSRSATPASEEGRDGCGPQLPHKGRSHGQASDRGPRIKHGGTWTDLRDGWQELSSGPKTSC